MEKSSCVIQLGPKPNGQCSYKRQKRMGLPSWSCGWDSKLPVQRGLGLIPGQGTRAHVPQLRYHWPQLKVPPVAIKTRHSQINAASEEETHPEQASGERGGWGEAVTHRHSGAARSWKERENSSPGPSEGARGLVPP